MTSSRPRVTASLRLDRAAPRRSDGEYKTLRPVLVYVVAALVAIFAAEALRWDREASTVQPARRHARHEPRRSPVADTAESGFVTPLSAFPSMAPAQAPAVPQPSSPEDADEQDDDATAGIAPEDWKMPPSPNPDPSIRPAIDDVWPTKGPEAGGQRVQIRGRNLQPVYVLFGRTPAEILGVDQSGHDVVLTLVAPKRTGPASEWIVVTNRDGSNATARFEYYR